MKVTLFDFCLPGGLVAQLPVDRRDESRLMVLPAGEAAASHCHFQDFPTRLSAGDLVVFNDTRVIPARLLARRPSGGRVELLLLEPVPGKEDSQGKVWDCLLKSSRWVRPNEVLTLKGGGSVRILQRGEAGAARIQLGTAGGQGGGRASSPSGSMLEYMDRHGELPLPPYIHRADPNPHRTLDRERYQTIFARSPGAVAAPTAGLHFTSRVLEDLEDRGVQMASLTLHVGAGTFRPVTVSQVEDHPLPPERFVLPPQTAAAIRRTQQSGKRVIACGTTVARVLESQAANGEIEPATGRCGLFILPGYRFRIIDGLLTNFHLPRSTLLMLVCAMAGRRRVLEAYQEAISRAYRFYSYGDAMLVFRTRQPG